MMSSITLPGHIAFGRLRNSHLLVYSSRKMYTISVYGINNANFRQNTARYDLSLYDKLSFRGLELKNSNSLKKGTCHYITWNVIRVISLPHSVIHKIRQFIRLQFTVRRRCAQFQSLGMKETHEFLKLKHKFLLEELFEHTLNNRVKKRANDKESEKD